MTPSPKAKDLEVILKEFEMIDGYLRSMHDVLAAGHMPDIADLDERIAHLCTNVEKSAPDTQEYCMTKLDELLRKLNECEDEMTAFQKASGDISKK